MRDKMKDLSGDVAELYVERLKDEVKKLEIESFMLGDMDNVKLAKKLI